MTLNGVMAVTLRYFNEFGKPAFQLKSVTLNDLNLILASSSIELIDQNSASITHRALNYCA